MIAQCNRELVRTLGAYSFTFASEAELQEAIGSALQSERLAFEREVVLASGDRIDFLLADGVGIETKVAGAIPRVAEQLQRYAASRRVCSLVLVTTRRMHAALPAAIVGKPLSVLVLTGGLR